MAVILSGRTGPRVLGRVELKGVKIERARAQNPPGHMAVKVVLFWGKAWTGDCASIRNVQVGCIYFLASVKAFLFPRILYVCVCMCSSDLYVCVCVCVC